MIISIVTVVYNDQPGLAKTVNSVKLLDNIDYEHIIVDGLSSDETAGYVNSLEGHHKYKIIQEQDNGIYDAMNKGISQADGNYIIFMNAGDIFPNANCLDLILPELNQDNVIVYGDSFEEHANGNWVYKTARDISKLSYGMFTHHQAIFYRRDLCKGGYDLAYEIGADYKFTASIYMDCQKYCYVKVPLCVFELGGASYKNFLKGLYDSYRVKRYVLKLGFLYSIGLCLIAFFANIFRRLSPVIYNMVRNGS